MIEVIERLPPRSVQQDGLTLKYIIIGASASDGTLAEFTGYTPCGRTAQQIFEDDVQPLVRR